MSYNQVYDCIKNLQAAVEALERENNAHKVDTTELQRRVVQLEEELAREKAKTAKQEKILSSRLATIEEVRQQRDSLRVKNAELVDRLAASGRRASAHSPLMSSVRK